MKSKLYITGLAVALFTLALTSSAQAAVVVNDRDSFNATILNPCNGEIVNLECDVHTVVRVTTNGNSFHFGFKQNIHCTGAGDQGNDYVVNAKLNQSVNSSTNSFSFTQTLTQQTVSKGGAPNFLILVTIHQTFANGVLRSDVVKIETKCVGD